MVKHIAAFYFSDIVNDSNCEEVKEKIIESVEKMKKANIPGVIKMEAIFNIAPDMPDFGIYSEFESEEALNNYQLHPDHLRHKNDTKDFSKGRVVFDWK